MESAFTDVKTSGSVRAGAAAKTERTAAAQRVGERRRNYRWSNLFIHYPFVWMECWNHRAAVLDYISLASVRIA